MSSFQSGDISCWLNYSLEALDPIKLCHIRFNRTKYGNRYFNDFNS